MPNRPVQSDAAAKEEEKREESREAYVRRSGEVRGGGGKRVEGPKGRVWR